MPRLKLHISMHSESGRHTLPSGTAGPRPAPVFRRGRGWTRLAQPRALPRAAPSAGAGARPGETAALPCGDPDSRGGEHTAPAGPPTARTPSTPPRRGHRSQGQRAHRPSGVTDRRDTNHSNTTTTAPARLPPPGSGAAARSSSYWPVLVTPSRLLGAARAAIGCRRCQSARASSAGARAALPRGARSCRLVRLRAEQGCAPAAGARRGAAAARAAEDGERGR